MEGERRSFLKEFVKNPRTVGAVGPSSSHLAEAMVDEIPWPEVRTAVEVGPGTGAFTGAIRERLREDARFCVVEINPSHCERLRVRFPDLTIHEGSAADLPSLCQDKQVDGADVVISGLPWAAFPSKLQDELPDAIVKTLRVGGRFASFSYVHGLPTPAGKRFRGELERRFSVVDASEPVWRNLPPAVVYRCVK